MILLDTHAWVWWLGAPEHLSESALEAVERARTAGRVCVSSISVWEAALLVERQRLTLTLPFHEWLARCESLPFLRFVPVDNRIAARSVHLPGELHKDPADRLIVATALELDVPLVTRDGKLRAHEHVSTIW